LLGGLAPGWPQLLTHELLIAPNDEGTLMLAEKFILLMEVLKSHAAPGGAPRVVSTSPHVPVKLPAAGNK
jgi:hypothetical protein